jgi:tetratricopeptide (TPR) repeat protein
MMRLLVLIICLLLLSPVYAKDEDKASAISARLYKKLQKTEALIAKKSYSQAEKKLNALLADVKDKSYEKAVVLRSLSSVHALKGSYNKAANTLSKAVALAVLPKKQEQQAILNLGQLYMAAEQYSKAIRVIEPWLAKNPTPDAQISALVANAYAQLKRYRKALPYIKRAIARTKKPAESWYQLNLALYYELNNYASAAKLLKKLIAVYPSKKQYWDQLASTYQQIKQYKKAVSIKHLAYKKGISRTEKDILGLVNLFLYVNSPYKAATLLKQGISSKKIKYTSKNWETLAHAWTMAKEFDRAVKALEIASNLNDKGSLYQQLGQIYVEQEQWGKAIQSFNKALSKGGLKNIGSTHLLLGMSYFEKKDNKRARRSFIKARQYSKNRKAANQWLKYISEPKVAG